MDGRTDGHGNQLFLASICVAAAAAAGDGAIIFQAGHLPLGLLLRNGRTT